MKNLIIIILIAINMVFAHSDGWMQEGMMHTGGGYIYSVILFVVLITVASAFLLNRSRSDKYPSAIEILKARLARNEITLEEFNKLRNAINE